MRRFAHGEAFDERAMPELDSEAIDFRAASESFAPLRRLARRGLVREIGTGPQDPKRRYYSTDTQ